MIKKHPSKKTKSPFKKVGYDGKLSDYQTNGISNRSKRYQHIEQDSFTLYQNFLYHRALFGLSIYPQREIVDMNPEKRKRIIKVHKRTQKVLNVWKQDVVLRLTNALFTALFPNSPITTDLIKKFGTDVDESLKCNISFKALNIHKKDIVEKLIEVKILPHNFYELKLEQLCR